jgi:hypothetical protein
MNIAYTLQARQPEKYFFGNVGICGRAALAFTLTKLYIRRVHQSSTASDKEEYSGWRKDDNYLL